MAVKTIKRQKKVFIDMRTAFGRIKRDTGEKITSKSFAEEYGICAITVSTWANEAPKVIRILHDFLKKHNLKFEDLVKKE